MPATYTKLRDGSWGVRVIGAAVTAGQSLTVNTKAGEAKSETIDRVLWSGDGASICSVVARKRQPSYGGDSQRAMEARARRYGWNGSRTSSSYYSSGLYDDES